MAADEISVDVFSLGDFRLRLQPRIDQAFAALNAMTTSPGSDRAALGEFSDASETAERHRALHDEYVARLRRLVDSLTVAQTATAGIIQVYQDADALNHTSAKQIEGAVGAVSEALDGDRGHA